MLVRILNEKHSAQTTTVLRKYFLNSLQPKQQSVTVELAICIHSPLDGFALYFLCHVSIPGWNKRFFSSSKRKTGSAVNLAHIRRVPGVLISISRGVQHTIDLRLAPGLKIRTTTRSVPFMPSWCIA